jgi:Winged helix DNA-binding domain
VQGTLMRATIHLVSADDYWPLALGVREPRRTAWIRVARRGLTEAEVASAAERVRTALAEGPLRRREIAALLGDKILANGVGMWLDLVRVPPSGTWERRRADLYELAERWLGPPEASVEDGRERLVRRYLEGLRPGTRRRRGELGGTARGRGRAHRAATRPTHPPRVAGRRAARPTGRAPARSRDAGARPLSSHLGRLAARARPTDRDPARGATPKDLQHEDPPVGRHLLVDGRVAGTWRWDRGMVRIEPFGRLDRATRTALDEEAEGLAHLHR